MADRYYWLKLKEDFFQQDPIEWLEEQENGKEYSLFYLKLCLKSLKNNGALVRQIGTKEVPYTLKKLAEITNTSVDVAKQAVEILKEIGLLVEADNGVLELPEVGNMVGNEAANNNALRQKRFRDKNSNAASNATSVTEPVTKGVTKSVTDSNASVTQRNADRNDTSNADSNAASNGTSVTENNESIEYRDKSIDNYYDDDNNPISLNSLQEETYSKAIKSKSNNSSTVVVDSIANSVFDLYSNNICPVSPILGEKLQALIGEVGEAAVKYGIEVAVEQGVRTLPYVQTCARNYLASGGKAGKQRPRGKPKVNDVEGAIAQIKAEMDAGGEEWWQ